MITVIGMDGGPLSAEAGAALATATLIAGGRRHLDAVRARLPAKARTVAMGNVSAALDAIVDHDRSGDATVVVLASGDPGFFGIVRALRARGLRPRVLPAVSSVARAFALAGLPWDDAVVVSAHGRRLRPVVNACRAHPKVAVLTAPDSGPAELAAALAAADGSRGYVRPRVLVVGERLGTPHERVTRCRPAEATARSWVDPNVVLVLAEDLLTDGSDQAQAEGLESPSTPPAEQATARRAGQPAERAGQPTERAGQPTERRARPPKGRSAGRSTGVGHPPERRTARLLRGPGDRHAERDHGPGWRWPRDPDPPGWALPEDAFVHRDRMVTKAEVRALVLARLGPRLGTLVWDVGAGSGSVAVECARFGAAVVAVERDSAQCDRIVRNAARHGVEVGVVHGVAPAALDPLPPPDAVFVGGGGTDVMGAVVQRGPDRVVVALATVERVGPAVQLLADAGYAVGGSQLQISRLMPLSGGSSSPAGDTSGPVGRATEPAGGVSGRSGGAHRLAAANPVFVVWGERT